MVVSAFVALMVLFGAGVQAGGGSIAFTGGPLESENWSRLCLERDRDPGYPIGVVDSPFREPCPLKAIKSSPNSGLPLRFFVRALPLSLVCRG